MMKKMMMGFMVLFGLVGSSLAAHNWEAPDFVGNWNVATNWNLGTVPGTADVAVIGQGVATVDTNVGELGALYMGHHNFTGTLNIVSNGFLQVRTDSGRIGRAGMTNAVGVINMTGGTLRYGASQEKRLILGLDTNTTLKEQGKMTISGGTFEGQLLIGQNLVGGSIDTFRVEGDAATIGSTAITSTPGLEVRYTGKMEFAFDDTGISEMIFADTASFHPSAKIVVDGFQYAGGTNTFSLIDAASFSGTPNIILANFYGGASNVYDTATGTFTVTATPAAVAAGDRIWRNNVVGNWAGGENWDNNLRPRSIDSSFIHTGTATIDSDVGLVAALHMGYTDKTGTLNIVDGGSLLVTTDSGRIGRSGLANSVGEINMSGGTLTYGTSQDKRIIIGLDSDDTLKEQGNMTISGGTFAGQILLGSGVVGGSGDLLRIEGDAATIGSTNAVGTGLEVRSTGDLEFIFDETGISTLSYSNALARFHDGSTILVDGSAYAGSNEMFTLIYAAAFEDETVPSITLTNFSPTAAVDYEWDSGNFTVTVTEIPPLVPSNLMIATGSNSLIIASGDLNQYATNTLQVRTSLVTGSWSNLYSVSGSVSNSWVITPLIEPASFYRVIAE